jgi:hypothetical protein
METSKSAATAFIGVPLAFRQDRSVCPSLARAQSRFSFCRCSPRMVSCSPSKDRRSLALAPKRPRPAAMHRDALVYGGHEPHRLDQGDDDFLVVPDVGVAK